MFVLIQGIKYVATTVLKYLICSTCNLFSGSYFTKGMEKFYSNWKSQLYCLQNSWSQDVAKHISELQVTDERDFILTPQSYSTTSS